METISRRGFLAMGVAGAAHLLRPAAALPSRITSPRKRRLLFNWDGSMIHCWGRTTLPHSKGPLTRDQFTSLVFTPIEDSAVDTVLFSFGSGNVAEYQSRVLEWPGEADNFQFPEERTWHAGIPVDPKDQYRNPKSLAEAGHNPPAVVVEECHRRGLEAFVSLRMNDCHDALRGRGQLPNPELPTFKRLNPDWLSNLRWWTALNFEKSQVRDLKLRVIEEFFDRWDFDGIELDWLRHTLNFPRGTERENAKHLNSFMRSVRRSLRERGRRRGRPIELGVRVPERLEWCLEGGYDVPTWISEDLVDFLILGQGLTELPELKEFRQLMTHANLPIYPCLYMYGNGYRVSPDAVIRGSAANLWRDGADGLYTFNWFTHGSWRKPLLDEIADPTTLPKKTKHYTTVHRFDSTPFTPVTDPIRYNTALRDAPLPFDLIPNGKVKTLLVPIADDPRSKTNRPRKAELWIGMHYHRTGDVLNLVLNGQPLEPGELHISSHWQQAGYEVSPPAGQGILGFPAGESYDMRFRALRLDLPVNRLKKGRNRLDLKLLARGTGSDKPLRVIRLEVLAKA